MTFQPPRDDFLRIFASGQFYDGQNSNPGICNLSVISQVHARSNETIAKCSYGFTKQQIQRLMSTNKKSSFRKKYKFKLDRPQIDVNKGGLFNVSNTSSETGLLCCHSSLNLLESKYRQLSKRLEVLEEKSTTQHSQLAAPHHPPSTTPQHPQLTIVPVIVITPTKTPNFSDFTKTSDCTGSQITSIDPKKLIDLALDDKSKDNTPKSKIPMPVKKTSSTEKIINRFKKVCPSVIPNETKESASPSCSLSFIKSNEFFDQICDNLEKSEIRKPRESLGTVLGVDNTFLDQFDLVD